MHLTRDTEIITTLWEWGASHKALDDHGRTPLFMACSRGNAECVEFLLRCESVGEDEDCSIYTESPAQSPVTANLGETAEHIEGRDGTERDGTGRTEGAEERDGVEGRDGERQERQKERSVNETGVGVKNIQDGDIATERSGEGIENDELGGGGMGDDGFLLSQPSALVDNCGDTPLHAACANGHIECVQLMLRQYFYLPALTTLITHRNDKGKTADEVAAANGHEECAILVAHHAGGLGHMNAIAGDGKVNGDTENGLEDSGDAQGQIEGLPHPWMAFTDEQTGYEYYYNTESGETSWEKPEGIIRQSGADSSAAET